MKSIALGAAVLGCAALAFSSNQPAQTAEQVGYFKGQTNNRVFAFHAPPGISEDKAREVLSKVMHSDGQLTYAVIYAGAQHPGHKLTTAPDYLTAVGLLDQPP